MAGHRARFAALLGPIALLAVVAAGCGDSPVVPPADEEAPIERPPETVVYGPLTAFVGVTALPMAGGPALADHTVVVQDGVISEIGPSDRVVVPDNAVIVDGHGRWLMPGLVDTHTHLGTNFSEFTNQRPPADELQTMAEGQMLLYLANGVTTIVNLGDFGEPLLRWRREVLRGEYPGPTIYAALYARGPIGSPDGGPPSRSVSNGSTGESFTRLAAREGWHYVKIYNWTPAAAVEAILRTSPEVGVPVIGHLPFTVGAKAVLDGGLSMVAHAAAYLWRHLNHTVDRGRIGEIVDMTVAADAALSTTLGIEETIAAIWGGNQAGIAAFWSRPENRFMHWTERALHEEGINGPRWNPEGSRPGELDDRLAFVQEYTRALYDGGVLLTAGTDSPTVLGVAGFSMLDELDALARLGLSATEALEIATRNGGRYVERTLGPDHRFGTIEPGMRADLLLLEADPTADLGNLRRRVAVMARGVLYDETELEAALDELAARY